MKEKVNLVLGIVGFIAGCSTSPSIKVIEQSDSKPSWATITRTVFEEGSKIKFVGYFTSEGDARPSAAINGSGTKARAMPLESISDDFLSQSGIAEDMRESSAKLVISTLRKNPPNIAGLQVTSNYYERVELTGSDGIPRTELRAYSLAECPKQEYEQVKKEALQKLKSDPQIKKELDNLMTQQRDRSYDERKPASASTKPSN